MKELTKKILSSGLVDEATASMMEKWGILEEGAADLAKRQELKDATREQLMKFAEEVGDEVDKDRRLRETMLDLNQIRWPVTLTICNKDKNVIGMAACTAVVDRMGRYYFRPQEVGRDTLVPGRLIMDSNACFQTILEVTELFVGDQIAAIQVSVQ